MKEFSMARKLMLIGAMVSMAGCATSIQNSLTAATSTVLLGHAPTTNINQTYYLGVFDPREQLPPTIYRIRLQGQASALSRTAFASGWVRADLLDSLSGRVDIDRGQVRLGDSKGNGTVLSDDKNELNRRLVLFGPEGFREAPKNHRLVVVMGSSPETFFNSVDRALGVVAGVTQASNAGPDVTRAIWADMSRLREERRGMQTLIDLVGKE
jgi:hypothetical protein